MMAHTGSLAGGGRRKQATPASAGDGRSLELPLRLAAETPILRQKKKLDDLPN